MEVLQILNTLKGISNGWSNHPAVRMWKGYENALVEYGIEVCIQWMKQGYKDSCFLKIYQHKENKQTIYPDWLGDFNFHTSHKSNLIRKLPEFYSNLWPEVQDDLPYVWPI